MKLFAVLAFAALAHARPEAGYAYNSPAAQAPSSSYGAPSGGSSGLTGIITGGGIGGTGFGGGSSYSSASSFGGSGGSSYSGGSYAGGSYDRAPIVSKHVYVHVAPEEPEVQRPARIIAPSQPRKHYKIVFIKAPTPATPQGAQIQLPQQDEEKTLIYVLSKKQEEQAEINIQQAAPTTPTKPEVYFIRYKTQKEQTNQAYGPPGGALGQPLGSGSIGGGSLGGGSLGGGSIGGGSLGGGSIGGTGAGISSSYGVPSSSGGQY